MLKKTVAVVLIMCTVLSLSSFAFALSTERKTTTRKLDDWYISDDGKYGVAIFGLDKHKDGTFFVTIYVKKMSSGQIVRSGDVDLGLDEAEWKSAAKKYGYSKVSFELPEDSAIQDFQYLGSKRYSFIISAGVILDDDVDNPIYYTQEFTISVP